ncbi:TPA: tRNA uridine(34) 5-carboxymethylaminomethyl modification radical SAM/GNAT enzyme Elp3 [Candidatus Woesearchaeota archaeon]|nr:tRNA uridine(34) 5-carboxymethylaminomethyl modification radical SAM/GNAT enzyme Elp3 [Candidatus Woesearchaeota archaeon]
MTKPTRTISGVAVVAIMTKPHKCPHGKCDICPGGVGSEFGDVPQSYTGKEPATLRALRNDFDPYLQVMNRLEQYVVTGHAPDKAELIIMGGTFPSMSKEYQKDFVMYALKAMNDFGRFFDGKLDVAGFKEFFMLPGEVADAERTKEIHRRLLEMKKKGESSLDKEQKRNEKAKIRCVGLTVETRPDYGRKEQGDFALSLGATRVELGVQTIYDDVLAKVGRGHNVEESVKAIQELRDLGFKLNLHYMLGLPGSSPARDVTGLKELFKDERFKPDMLKIYPCMVLKGTKLYKMWQEGEYKPLPTQKAAEIIAEFKSTVPPYCRIMRVQRDISSNQIDAGPIMTNLRQLVDRVCKEKGIKCRCIRCREAGRAKKIGKAEISVVEYDASGGKEFFISAEDKKNDVLLGFCRLRLPGQLLRKEITGRTALVRELHVYGTAAGLGNEGDVQHRGWGKKLLRRAEEIALSHGKDKVVVISGIGVREYYRGSGYKKEGPYMSKRLNI